MPRSMTGYGRAQMLEDGRDVLVEIRAVNHRYYEFSARLPRTCLYLEEKLKSFLNGRIGRGKVEVSVTITRPDGKDAQIAVNRSVAEGYVNALRMLNEELGENGGLWLSDDLMLNSLLRLPDVFTVTKEQEDENAVWTVVSAAAAQALDSFVKMREAEGSRLAADLFLAFSLILLTCDITHDAQHDAPVLGRHDGLIHVAVVFRKVCPLIVKPASGLLHLVKHIRIKDPVHMGPENVGRFAKMHEL